MTLSERDALESVRALLAPPKISPRLRRAIVLARAIDAFADTEKGKAWLSRPNRALSGATPRSLLATRDGCERVLTLLGQIEHGIYS